MGTLWPPWRSLRRDGKPFDQADRHRRVDDCCIANTLRIYYGQADCLLLVRLRVSPKVKTCQYANFNETTDLFLRCAP